MSRLHKLPHALDEEVSNRLPFPAHGSLTLPAGRIQSYNLELRERGQFVGDRANKTAFVDHLEKHRRAARRKRG